MLAVCRTELEHKVHDVWAEALGAPRIGMLQNFFSAGGTSLLAGMVALKLNEMLGCEESATLLFNNPTIEAIAAKMETLPTSAISRQVDLQSAFRLSGLRWYLPFCSL